MSSAHRAKHTEMTAGSTRPCQESRYRRNEAPCVARGLSPSLGTLSCRGHGSNRRQDGQPQCHQGRWPGRSWSRSGSPWDCGRRGTLQDGQTSEPNVTAAPVCLCTPFPRCPAFSNPSCNLHLKSAQPPPICGTSVPISTSLCGACAVPGPEWGL